MPLERCRTGPAGWPPRAARALSRLALPGVALAASLCWGVARATPAATTVGVDVMAVGADSGNTAGVSLDGRPIRAIRIDTRNIFDPLPAGPLRPLYQLANRVHVRTRELTVRDQLLLRPGEPWTRERGREAARHLRTLDFIEPVALAARPAGDSVDVRVETRDVWTTQPEFDFERASGRQYGSFAFTERNLFGLGKSVTFDYREDPVGISRSVFLNDPGVMGSRLRLRYAASRGTGGASDEFSAGVPFYSEDTPWSLGVSGSRSGREAHLFRDNSEVAVLDENFEETEAFLGRGWRAGSNVIRLTGSLWTLERRQGPTRWDPAVSRPSASMIGPEEALRLRRAALELRVWEPRYVERVGVDRVDRVEDFDLGPSVALKLGVAPRGFGSTANEGYARLRVDAGARTASGFGWIRTSVSTRWRRGPIDIVEQASARWVWQRRPEHTVVAAASGIAGFRTSRSFQRVVGGLNGLRAYPVHAVAGTQLVRWNLEDRRMLVRDVFQLMSIGSAVFVDGARAWGAGAEGTSAFHAAGFGVRLAPPRAALGPVIRMDLAWPLSPTRDGRRAVVVSVGSSHAF